MMHTDFDTCWEILQRRDTSYDGVFFVGVRTTRIYCRPSCSARPLRKNVAFYPTTAAAREAGLRACLRCHPDNILPETALVHAVCAYIDAQPQTPTLGAIATAVQYSSFYVNRIFKQQTGITPRQYAVARQTERLAGLLRSEPTSITRAIMDAGYASVGTAYYAQPFGMALRDVRRGGAGMTLDFDYCETDFGVIGIAQTAHGVCAVVLADTPQAVTAELSAQFPQAVLQHAPTSMETAIDAVRALAYSHPTNREIRLDIRATAFQQRVWEALRRIPAGETRSYADVARDIGQPTAVRAVAQACAQNPVAIIIPCHRVVHTDTRRDGYRWGTARKQALLTAERTQTPEANG